MTDQWSGMKAAPCPWCGREEIHFHEVRPKVWAGVCSNCNAIGPHSEPQGLLRALDRWNDLESRTVTPSARTMRSLIREAKAK